MELEAAIYQARQCILRNQKAQARAILNQVLRDYPHHEQAWILSAQVSDRPEQVLYCLNRALKINPASPDARAMIARLQQPPAEPPPVPPVNPSAKTGPLRPLPAPPPATSTAAPSTRPGIPAPLPPPPPAGFLPIPGVHQAPVRPPQPPPPTNASNVLRAVAAHNPTMPERKVSPAKPGFEIPVEKPGGENKLLKWLLVPILIGGCLFSVILSMLIATQYDPWWAATFITAPIYLPLFVVFIINEIRQKAIRYNAKWWLVPLVILGLVIFFLPEYSMDIYDAQFDSWQSKTYGNIIENRDESRYWQRHDKFDEIMDQREPLIYGVFIILFLPALFWTLRGITGGIRLASKKLRGGGWAVVLALAPVILFPAYLAIMALFGDFAYAWGINAKPAKKKCPQCRSWIPWEAVRCQACGQAVVGE